jgi:hypothetical protein
MGDSEIAKDYGSRIGFMCDVGLLNYLVIIQKGRTVQGSKPGGGKIFNTHPDHP